MPALRVVPVATHVPVAVPDALIFTSLNGIRLHRFLPALANRQVFAVGDHSARFARAIGYRRVMSASGNVSDLAKLIVAHSVPGSTVLHKIGRASGRERVGPYVLISVVAGFL